MKAITEINAQAIPLAMNNVDTDLIIPAQYLTSVSTEGYGEHLFHRLRQQDPNFVFNQPQYAGSQILISQENFGCGSSREHAVWALQQAGIQCVIAISFADIFYNNAGKNGLLLITQPSEIINELIKQATQQKLILSIQLAQQKMQTADGASYSFKLDPFIHHCLANGLDELDYLLASQNKINQFKQQQVSKDQVYFIPKTEELETDTILG